MQKAIYTRQSQAVNQAVFARSGRVWKNMASRKSSIEQVTVPSKSTGHSAVPSLAIAEELRGRLDEPFIVIRAAGDTDEDVEAGQKLIAAALAFARRK